MWPTLHLSHHDGSAQVDASIQSMHHGDGIRLGESGSGRHSLSESGDAAGELGKAVGEVESGGFSLNVVTNGEDYLAIRVGLNALYEWINGEMLRQYAVQWRDFAAETVVETTKGATALNRQNICGVLNYADSR